MGCNVFIDSMRGTRDFRVPFVPSGPASPSGFVLCALCRESLSLTTFTRLRLNIDVGLRGGLCMRYVALMLRV